MTHELLDAPLTVAPLEIPAALQAANITPVRQPLVAGAQPVAAVLLVEVDARGVS